MEGVHSSLWILIWAGPPAPATVPTPPSAAAARLHHRGKVPYNEALDHMGKVGRSSSPRRSELDAFTAVTADSVVRPARRGA